MGGHGVNKPNPSRSLGAFHPVMNGFSKHLLNINAMVHMNVSPPKAATPNKPDFRQNSLCQSFLSLGIHGNGSPMFLISAQCQHLSQRTCQIGLRSNGTWDDTTVIIPLHLLKHRARETGVNVSIAEVLTLAGIKHHEMPEEYHQYKGRIVYRGDRITNQMGDHVLFSENETATTPNAIAALNLTLWYGAMSIVSCADCIQAYLQCKLDGSTWVILPFELWLPEWKKAV